MKFFDFFPNTKTEIQIFYKKNKISKLISNSKFAYFFEKKIYLVNRF